MTRYEVSHSIDRTFLRSQQQQAASSSASAALRTPMPTPVLRSESECRKCVFVLCPTGRGRPGACGNQAASFPDQANTQDQERKSTKTKSAHATVFAWLAAVVRISAQAPPHPFKSNGEWQHLHVVFPTGQGRPGSAGHPCALARPSSQHPQTQRKGSPESALVIVRLV